MTALTSLRAAARGWFDPAGREAQIRDYGVLLDRLIWKRQASFLSGTILTCFYFDPVIALACYAFVLVAEVMDQQLGRVARTWDGHDEAVGRRILKGMTLNTVLSAVALSAFCISITIQQTSGGHFTPLFFLFSAALFAAMYTSQILGILVLRLSIYATTFLFMALLDVVRFMPPLRSPIWLEFFTMVLVIYFVADMSWQFYSGYRRGLRQMRQIERENERSKAALEVKSQFVSIVSHELRTPLTSIKGSIDLINSGRMGELSPTMKSLMEIAGRNSNRLAYLIDDLLDLQKMEAGEMSFNFEPLDVADIVHEAVESVAGFATKLGIRIETEVELRRGFIRGDRMRLIQALQNLLSNALKFSHEGGRVVIRATAMGPRIRISVEDQGVGIPEGAEELVFGKFMQVDSSERRKVGGTGLGLNITKQIVERHRGSIGYESELGVGSVFTLDFDRHVEPASHIAASPQRASEGAVRARRVEPALEPGLS